MPLSILAVANTALAAIQQGCELYKEYKGTVLQAKETFDEVATEVVSVWGFLKNKLFTKKDVPKKTPIPVKTKKAPKELDEAAIKLDLVAQLKIFFKCQEQLQQKLAEAEERSLNADVNKMESALDIEFVMAEVQEMQNDFDRRGEVLPCRPNSRVQVTWYPTGTCAGPEVTNALPKHRGGLRPDGQHPARSTPRTRSRSFSRHR
jgi:hypothetical protein